jgi:hypothetical protein
MIFLNWELGFFNIKYWENAEMSEIKWTRTILSALKKKKKLVHKREEGNSWFPWACSRLRDTVERK